MPAPTVTNTFSNATTIVASEHNQNFTDIINALTDGTKSFSIDALTLAGALTANGAATLGNASTDDLTINASLASALPIKTNNSYDIGSATLGLAGIYLGSTSTYTTRVRAYQTLTGSNTFILPNGNGNSREHLETDGSGNLSWVADRKGVSHINCGVACAVGSSALTITLQGANGSTLSSTNPAFISFRNSTAATGTPVTRTLSSDISLTLSSGSTIGHVSGRAHYFYLYALDNSGTVELAVSSVYFDEGTLISTTAEGGSGGADSGRTIYSASARSSVPIRCIARMVSTQTTAGTWGVVPTEISFAPFNIPKLRLRYTTNTSGAFAATPRNFEDLDYDNTPSLYASGVFTSPYKATWRYCVGLQTASQTWTAGNAVNCIVQVDGSNAIGHATRVAGFTDTVEVLFTNEIELDAGQTLEFDTSASGGPNISADPLWNYLAISEV